MDLSFILYLRYYHFVLFGFGKKEFLRDQDQIFCILCKIH